MPTVTTTVPPPDGVTETLAASVKTACVGTENVPAGTVTPTVDDPIAAVALPPLGWIVVTVTTEPGSPVAVLPGVGVPGA